MSNLAGAETAMASTNFYAKAQQLASVTTTDTIVYDHQRSGRWISTDQNTLRAGARGPALQKDFVAFARRFFHFDLCSESPERIVHAFRRGGARLCRGAMIG